MTDRQPRTTRLVAALVAALGAAAGLLLSGCAGSAGVPVVASSTTGQSTSAATGQSTAPTEEAAYSSIELTWWTGSVPPPYNYSWVVAVSGASGTLTYKVNYADGSSWSRPFTLDAAAAAKLSEAVRGFVTADWPEAENGVGGPSGRYLVVGADGNRFQGQGLSPDQLTALEALGKSAVPGQVWSAVQGEFDTWQQAKLAATSTSAATSR